MTALVTFYHETRALLNLQPPKEWDYQLIEKSQETIKTARVAEWTFSRIAVVGILLGAFAFKSITSPIWVPTIIFAGLTALVCFILSLNFTLLINKFQKWKELPEEKIKEIIFPPLLKAIKNSSEYDDLYENCKKIETNMNRKFMMFKNYASHYHLTFNFQFSDKHKLELLWEANKRQLLLVFPRNESRDNEEFVLEYVQFIFEQIRIEQNRIVQNRNYTSLLALLPDLAFNEQFKLLNMPAEGQPEWEGIKVIDDKKMVALVAQSFPIDKLVETCSVLQKSRIPVGVVLHPGKDEDKQKILKMPNKTNMYLWLLSDEEAGKFCLANVTSAKFTKIQPPRNESADF